KASVGSGTLRVRLLDPAQRPPAERVLAERLGADVHREADPAALAAPVADPARAAAAVAALADAGVEIDAFAVGQPSLAEVFMALTGRPPEETAAVGEPGQSAEVA